MDRKKSKNQSENKIDALKKYHARFFLLFKIVI